MITSANALIEYAQKTGVYRSNSRIDLQTLYWEVVDKIQSEEEQSFIKAIAKDFEIECYSEDADIIIDIEFVKKITLDKAKQLNIVPVLYNQVPAILTTNPFVNYTGRAFILCTRDTLLKYMHKAQSEVEQTADVSQDDIDIEDEVTSIIGEAVLQNISDIHIEWEMGYTIIKMRQHGDLTTVKSIRNYDAGYHERIVNKIYDLSGINANDFASIHDRKIAIELLRKKINIRVSSVPVLKGEGETRLANIMLRLIYSAKETQGENDFEQLGYSKEAVEAFLSALKMPYGMILLCGPTGSGKTTTLYTLLNIKKKEPVKIVTIEDPIESHIKGITQVEVNEDKNITFYNAIRSFLRHDPDVILVGETRDKETAEEACRASLTGHLVFSTIHANTSSAVIPRLIDLGVDRRVLSSVLKLIVAQRLVKKLCPYCRITVSADDHKAVKTTMGIEPRIWEQEYRPLFFTDVIYTNNPEGCSHCHHGYNGRTVLWEILKITERIQKMISDGEIITDKNLFSDQQDMTFQFTAIQAIQSGVTTIQEVEKFVPLSMSLKSVY